mgnify:FL=1
MTTAAKTWVTIIVLIILGVIGWAWYSHSSGSYMEEPADTMQQAPVSQTSADNSTPAMSSNSDTSDSGIDQDMTSVNAQMNAVDSDSANANQ